MNRTHTLHALASHRPFDLAVIGGGATGLGVALDAALRGLSVALVEAQDFAGGTSSRSTKLLHGGVRYLAQGNIGLVREALAERATVMKIAPHLAQPLPFVLPTWQHWQKFYYASGLKLYDLLAGARSLGATQCLSAEQTLGLLPGVRKQGLCGGVAYWDGQFDDARLALALAQSAHAAGALVCNYLEVQAVFANDEAIKPAAQTSSLATQPTASKNPAGQARFALEVKDTLDADAPPFRLQARCVVNATGVWVDQLRQRVQHSPVNTQTTAETLVTPSQGVHVVVERRFLGGDHALLVPKTKDGRVLFAVPWLGSVVLGTTDTPREDIVREPRPFAHEFEFILSEASKALQQEVRPADIRSTWVGLRPLVKATNHPSDTKSLSREHTLMVERSGVLTVTGGKWTTYRAMAEDVLNTASRHGLLHSLPPSRSANTSLFGAPMSGQKPTSLTQPPGIHLFGSQGHAIRALPGADNVIGLGLSEAMVRYCARFEAACTVEDLLARRWRALFLDAQLAQQMAPRVATILQEENQTDPHLQSFLDLCTLYQTPVSS